MRASLPALGAVFELPTHSASRIPHLRAHLLAHRTRSRSGLLPKPLPAYTRQRWLTSSPQYANVEISLDQVHPGLADGTSSTPRIINEQKTETSQRTRSVTDVYVDFPETLQARDPDQILFALCNPSYGHDFIRAADSATFTQALTLLDPDYLLVPIRDTYRFMKPSLSIDPTYRWVRPIEERLDSFAQILDRIIKLRLQAGHALTLENCRVLLNWARKMGKRHMARQVFQQWMPASGVEPDLACYNHYMEACCWSRAWHSLERWRFRVTPRLLGIRSKNDRPPDLRGHSVASSVRKEGLRHAMLLQFQDLVKRGYDGDEATFTNLLVAMGREADISGAKSILKSVYNIDVDLLNEVDEEEGETPTFYEINSPLRPTARLLFTLAHVFCSNNQPGQAYQLVDYVSRQYDLPIPVEVWMHLLEWTFVLQKYRGSVEREQGQHLGQVPGRSLERLWQIMTDEPHNIEPNLTAYTLRARARIGHRRLDGAVSDTRAATAMLEAARTDFFATSEALLEWLTSWHATNDPHDLSTPLPSEWFRLRRAFLLQSLALDRDIQLLSTCLRKLFTETCWDVHALPAVPAESDPSARASLTAARQAQVHANFLTWERRTLPSFLLEFAEYLPNRLKYRTRTGTVELDGKRHRAARLHQRWRHQTTRAGIIRAAIDVDHEADMRNGMVALVEEMRVWQRQDDLDAGGYCWTCERWGHTDPECTAPAAQGVYDHHGSPLPREHVAYIKLPPDLRGDNSPTLPHTRLAPDPTVHPATVPLPPLSSSPLLSTSPPPSQPPLPAHESPPDMQPGARAANNTNSADSPPAAAVAAGPPPPPPPAVVSATDAALPPPPPPLEIRRSGTDGWMTSRRDKWPVAAPKLWNRAAKNRKRKSKN